MIDLEKLTMSLAYSKISQEKLGQSISLMSQSINHVTKGDTEELKELRNMMHGLLLVVAAGSFQAGLRKRDEKSGSVCEDCGEVHE